jgi:hypothetical protein
LAERFGWTPNEILEQDPRIIDGLFVIMQVQSQEQAKAEKDSSKGSGTKTKRRQYISKDGG